MSLTTKYFAVAAAGSGDGSSAANAAALFTGGAWSTTLTGFGFNTNGMEARIMAGTHTITVALTSGLFTNAPTILNPLIFHGADASGNLLEPPNLAWTADQPEWDTTGLPVLNTTTNIATITSGLTAARLINFTASGRNGAIVSAGEFDWCAATNSAANSSAVALNNVRTTNSWAKCSGSSYAEVASVNSVSGQWSNVRLVGVTGSSGNRHGLIVPPGSGDAGYMSRICVVGVGGNGVLLQTSSTTSNWLLDRFTVVNCGGTGIALSTTASPATNCLITGCIVTGCLVGIDGGNSSTLLTNNCVSRNTTPTQNLGNYTPYDAVTSSGADSTDYFNSAGNDFRISQVSGFANRGIGVSSMPPRGPMVGRDSPQVRAA